MKIVYIHQYFKTPEEGGAIRSYYLAKALVDNGHEVEMITSHNEKREKFKVVEGVKVHYIPVFYHNSLGFIGRIFAFVRFMILAYQKVKTITQVELVYASSTPLTVGWLALRLKKKCGIPYYFEVRDLWPEAPVQLGVIKNKWLINRLEKLELEIYQNATKLITLSTGMRVGIEQKVPGRYASLLPNMADCDFFTMSSKQDALLEKYKVRNRFTVAYIGAMGKVNYLPSLVKIAKYCKEKAPHVHFLVAGDGAMVPWLLEQIKGLRLNNVNYLGYLNKEGVKEMLNVCDASFISFAKAKILETNSPNKFFDSIASGKLVIVNTQGWIKELIELKKAGFYFEPDDPAHFLDLLEPYLTDKSLLFETQSNARKLAENYFERALVCRNFLRLFESVHSMDPVISSVYTLTA